MGREEDTSLFVLAFLETIFFYVFMYKFYTLYFDHILHSSNSSPTAKLTHIHVLIHTQLHVLFHCSLLFFNLNPMEPRFYWVTNPEHWVGPIYQVSLHWKKLAFSLRTANTNNSSARGGTLCPLSLLHAKILSDLGSCDAFSLSCLHITTIRLYLYYSVPCSTASHPNSHNSRNPNSDTSTEPDNTKANWYSQLGGAQWPWGAWAICQDLQTKTNQTWIHSGRITSDLAHSLLLW